MCTGFWLENLRERDHWVDQDVGGRIVLMDLQGMGGGYGDWMELAQDRERWRAFVGTVRNLRVPKMWENYIIRSLVICTPNPILCGW